jgi:AraC-like DNA-binding protein/AmiR/NasT family two-component response regulator
MEDNTTRMDESAGQPILLWVDVSVTGELREVPEAFAEQCRVIRVGRDGVERVRERGVAVDFIVADYDYPDMDGLKFLEALKRQWVSTPVVMVTLHHSEEIAVWALRARAWDYLVRPAPAADVRRCLAGLKRIIAMRTRQRTREALGVDTPLPREARFRAETPRKRVGPALAYMASNYHKAIREAEMGGLCGLSTYRFSRVFREETGTTFQAHLVALRLERAKALLDNPSASITDIGYTVGFNSPSYFARAFRNAFGVSPSEYRAQNRKHKQPAKSDRPVRPVEQTGQFPRLASVMC